MARTCSASWRIASRPPWIFGCSVLTRPSIISGKPVRSDTSRTLRPASVRARAVPPVETSSMPKPARKRANSASPVLSETERRAREMRRRCSGMGRSRACTHKHVVGWLAKPGGQDVDRRDGPADLRGKNTGDAVVLPGRKSPIIAVRPGFIWRMPEQEVLSRIGTGSAHEWEMTDVYAAGFPSGGGSGDGGRDARRGANVFGRRDDRQRNARHRIDSGLYAGMDASGLSL